jgi:hypothetical protein
MNEKVFSQRQNTESKYSDERTQKQIDHERKIKVLQEERRHLEE